MQKGLLGVAIIVVMVALSFLSSCDGNCLRCGDFKTVDSLVAKIRAKENHCPPPKAAVIVVDATYSMQGFIIPSLRGYEDFIKIAHPDNIEYSLQQAFNTVVKTSYYIIKDTLKRDTGNRFAQDTFRYVNRTEIRQIFLKPDFFTGIANDYSYVFRKIFRDYKENKDKIYIIVTDLFQSDNDITKVIASIEPLVKEDFSIGIVGFTAQFDGTVYDISIMGKARPYKGKRKFYLIVAGRYCHVKRFINIIDRTSKSVIFTLEPIDSILIDTLSLDSLNGIVPYHRGRTSFCGKKTSPRIKGNIKLNVFYNKRVFISNELSWEASTYLDNNLSQGCKQILESLRKGKVIDLSALKPVSNVVNVKHFDRSKLILSFDFNTARYSPHCNQRGIVVEIKPKAKTLKVPKWVDEWNMTSLIGRKDELGKTYNLRQFVVRLYNLYLSRLEQKEVIYGCVQY